MKWNKNDKCKQHIEDVIEAVGEHCDLEEQGIFLFQNKAAEKYVCKQLTNITVKLVIYISGKKNLMDFIGSLGCETFNYTCIVINLVSPTNTVYTHLLYYH